MFETGLIFAWLRKLKICFDRSQMLTEVHSGPFDEVVHNVSVIV